MFEANFDGLVGPSHHYAGLAFGNVASMTNEGDVSNPREAALQGLRKMKALRDLGLRQGVLPPLRRPNFRALRALGFAGSEAEILGKAYARDPKLLSACYGASAMWVANAATQSPSPDTADGRSHFTIANLFSKSHRAIEPESTGPHFRQIFGGERFVVHDPIGFAEDAALSNAPDAATATRRREALARTWGDEGAANFGRLAPRHGAEGIELFVYGHDPRDPSAPAPAKFPARQSREASERIADRHGVRRAVFAQQNPAAIDAGVFHNDVISVTNENAFFLHEQAFRDPHALRAGIEAHWTEIGEGKPLAWIEVSTAEVPLLDCVRSYLFNSQLVSLPDGAMALVCPEECQKTDSVRAYLERLVADGRSPIRRIYFFDLKQSMKNGGGPACLRLRVVLSESEAATVAPGIWLNDARYGELEGWIRRHYRDRLAVSDLRDVTFAQEIERAHDELGQILGLTLV